MIKIETLDTLVIKGFCPDCASLIRRKGKIVYGSGIGSWSSNCVLPPDTYKAILIDIEPIKPCEHPKEKVNKRIDWEGVYECDCGQRVTPSAFGSLK